MLLMCYRLTLDFPSTFDSVITAVVGSFSSFFSLVEVCWCLRKDLGVIMSRYFLSVIFAEGRSCCSEKIWFCPASKGESSLLWAAWWQSCCWWCVYFFVHLYEAHIIALVQGFSFLSDLTCLVSLHILVSASNWALISFCMSPTFLRDSLSDFIDWGIISMFDQDGDIIVYCSIVSFSSVPRCWTVHWYGECVD